MKKFLTLVLVALLAIPMVADAKRKKKKNNKKKKPEPVKYEKITFSVDVDTEYQGEGDSKKKVTVFNLSARNPNKGNAEGLAIEVYAIYKHKDKPGGVYSCEQLKVGNKGISIKGGGKWTGKAEAKNKGENVVYYDYIAVLSNGGKELRTSGGSQWKKLVTEISGMQKGDLFNSKGELLEAGLDDVDAEGDGGGVAADGAKKKGGKKKKKGGKKKNAAGNDNGGGEV